MSITYTFRNKLYTYRIGRNAKDNWDLIDTSDPEDWWFHIDGFSSAHVVMKSEGPPDLSALRHGAALCKENTNKCKSIKNLPITYTQIKNVKKDKAVGSVTIKNYKTLKL